MAQLLLLSCVDHFAFFADADDDLYGLLFIGYARSCQNQREIALEIGGGVSGVLCQDGLPGAGVNTFRPIPIGRSTRQKARIARMLLLLLT
jgi:hypothetical protein